jgi:EpsI family protein
VLDFSFLRRRPAQLATVVLLTHAAIYYGRYRAPESVPLVQPLAAFPTSIESWSMLREYPMETQVLEVLRADDTLSRSYSGGPTPEEMNLFMAYFRSQKFGQRPHSPLNCLPASGWEPVKRGQVLMNVPGRGEPIEVNRYVVQRGPYRSLVMYFYLSHRRVVASEYWAQIFSVVDGIRYNRSDTSIVRVVVSADRIGDDQAEKAAEKFLQALFPHLEKYFPA